MIPSGPPLSSRAIVMVGGIALFCLALITALILESGGNAGGSQLQLDIPAEQASEQTSQSDPSAGQGGGLLPLAATEAAGDRVLFDAESHPISTGVITALEQAAEEPLDVELNRLLEAIQQGFGESSIQIAPSLRPYAYRLAGRMNIRPGAYRVRVAAPSEELANARAEVLGRLFELAGVVNRRLTFVPGMGIHSLTADPA